MEIYNEIIAKLHQLASFERAKTSKKFFKIGITEYGFDDIFIGVSVPMIRVIAKEYIGINYENIKKILSSKIHEERRLALMILVEKFMKFKEERWQKLKRFPRLSHALNFLPQVQSSWVRSSTFKAHLLAISH